MPNLTSVGLTAGVPTSGTGTVSTLDALLAVLPAALATGGGLYVAGQRGLVTKFTITNANTTYTSGQNIGGITTIATGLAAGTVLTAAVVRLKATSTVWTTANSANVAGQLFDASPLGTFTDGSAVAFAVGDPAKMMSYAASAGTIQSSMVMFNMTFGRLIVGTGGNIFLSLQSTGSSQIFAGAASFDAQLEALY